MHQILFQFPFFSGGDTPGPQPLRALPQTPWEGRGGKGQGEGKGEGKGGEGKGLGEVCVIAVGGDRRHCPQFIV